MKNIIRILFCSVLLVWTTNVKADVQLGVGGILGLVSTDGTETEGTAADTSDRSKSIDEFFAGADLFIEAVGDNGGALGISYIPFDVDLGSGSRTDSDGDDAAENDDGTRTASAELTDFYTIYANMPMGSNGFYALLGYHFATVETTETLNESSYGNVDIEGYQLGFGKRSDNVKYELAYSDFEDIKITATGGGTNSVSADADALTFRISYGF
jgi:hypothetical protein